MFHDTATTLARARGHPRPGRPDRDRRLRHRLLVARLPAPLPGRHPQDRPRVRRSRPTTRGLGVRRRDRGPGPRAGADDHRRGHRGARPARAPARARLRATARAICSSRPPDAEATTEFLADGLPLFTPEPASMDGRWRSNRPSAARSVASSTGARDDVHPLRAADRARSPDSCRRPARAPWPTSTFVGRR